MSLFGKNPEKTGSIDLPREGYFIKWDPDGLQIEVTDYHAEKLNLSWVDILMLAEQYRPRMISVVSREKKKRSKYLQR